MKQQNSLASLEKRLANINSQISREEQKQNEFFLSRGNMNFISTILVSEELFGNGLTHLYEEQKTLLKKISKTKKATLSVAA